MRDGAHSGGPPDGDPRSPDPQLTEDPGDAAVPVLRPIDTSIETEASTRALRLLVEHLDARPVAAGAAAAGDVISVTGRVGTGKTHLAGLLIEGCRAYPSQSDRPVRPVYLDLALVAADSFYARFVEALPQQEVTTCVREYHTDLVGRQINDESLGEQVTLILRSPGLTLRRRQEHIDRFGLSEATLLAQLQEVLTGVVDDRRYATAFTFLLREGLDRAAWSWLAGNPPAEILVERGFGERAPGAGTSGEFADLAPFARLYERQRYRLVLIIDNLDQLQFASEPDRQMRTFGKMVDRLREAGALVFLLSADDPSDRLGLGRAGRISAHIEMPLWRSAATVERFLRAKSPDGKLSPFLSDAPGLIADVTGGQPAAVGDFSVQLRAVAQQTDEEISAEVVRREARKYFASIDRAGLIEAVSRALDSRSWYFRTDQEMPLNEGLPVRVDFWIPSDGPVQAGCALVIVDVPVDATTVSGLTTFADALDRAEARNEALILVTGVLSSEHADQIRARFRREPLVYSADSFDIDLESAVKAMRHVLADSAGGALAGISDRVTAIERQQGRTIELVERVLSAVEGLRTEPAELVDRSAPAVEPAQGAAPVLPPAVGAVFDRVRGAIEDLGGPGAISDELFAADADIARDRADALRRLTYPDSGLMTAIGAAHAALLLIDAFRSALESWYRMSLPTASATTAADAELTRLCDRYADLVRILPLAELRGLARTEGSALPSRDTHYEVARERVQRLADEVRAALPS